MMDSPEEKIKTLERENRRLQREITRLKDSASQERSAYSSVLNQEKARTFLHRERGRYLMLLLANSPNIIMFIGRTGRIDFCTNYFVAKTDYGHVEHVLGNTLSETLQPFLDAADHKAFMAQIKEANQSNASASFEVAFTFQGERSDFAGIMVPMTGGEGDVGGMMLLFHDITDLKRTREEALAANRAKSNFLSNMSHEMRTPLNAIIGMTAVGKRSKYPFMKDEAFKKIEGASTFLLGIINDVLDISKIESGKLDLSPINFDFMQLVNRVVSVVAVRMQEKNQLFNVNIDPTIPVNLYADDHCLAQVIINILSNANKFAPEYSEVSLRADLAGLEEGLCHLRITIKDAGIGMTPEEQEVIFNIFQQAEAGISRKYGGSGLGLSITKHILDLMGGKIKVESEKGKGTTFTIDISLALASGDAGKDDEKGDYLNRDYTGKTILVVDDIDINLEVVALLLESVNATVVKTKSAKEALGYLFADDQPQCDLILMDLQMPEMDGLQATRIIRQSQMRNVSAVPIIAMTANVFKEDIEKCHAAGMDGHLGKPLDVDAFMRVLDKYL
jgi:PAS domain S-box-containing protein